MPQYNESGKHIAFIIKRGLIAENITFREEFIDNNINPAAKSINNLYFTKEALTENDYIDNPVWSKILSFYNHGKYIAAMTVAPETDGGKLILTSSRINCSSTHKLLVDVDRMDVNRILLKNKRSVSIRALDENGNQVSKINLSGLNDMNIRCEAEIPYHVNDIFLEISLSIESDIDTGRNPSALVLAIGNLWLEGRTNSIVRPNSSL